MVSTLSDLNEVRNDGDDDGIARDSESSLLHRSLRRVAAREIMIINDGAEGARARNPEPGS